MAGVTERPDCLTEPKLQEWLEQEFVLGRRLGRPAVQDLLGVGCYKAKKAMAWVRGCIVSPVPKDDETPEPTVHGEKWEHKLGAERQEIHSVSKRIKTLDEAIAEAKVDTAVWEVERYLINKWDMGHIASMTRDESGYEREAEALDLWQVKVWLKRKVSASFEAACGDLLARVEKASPTIKPTIYPRAKRWGDENLYEVSVKDLHLGLRCFKGGADIDYDPAEAERIFKWAIESLLEAGAPYEPTEILFTIGDDYLHADGVFHTTTTGTGQPEMDSWQHIVVHGERLLIWGIDRLQQVAPVTVLVIPGNHARQTEYMLGRIINAYYRKNANVTINADPDPYKFHRHGVNLIGFEHGHSVSAVRLAALMANECGADFSETKYREWHLGDQHRKGSSKPSMLEEQGVSIEYLPGLTAPNEWHRLKSFNHQKRGAMGYVWNRFKGPIARLQVNLDSYTGREIGEG